MEKSKERGCGIIGPWCEVCYKHSFFLATTKSWLLGHLLLHFLFMFKYGCFLFSLSKSWTKFLHIYCRDLVHEFQEEKRRKGSSRDLQHRDQDPPTSSYSLRVSQEKRKFSTIKIRSLQGSQHLGEIKRLLIRSESCMDICRGWTLVRLEGTFEGHL